MSEELEAAAVAKRITQSSILLVAVNLAPLLGVLFLNWDVFHILALFWFENVIIGVFGIARLTLAGDGRGMAKRLFEPIFFTVHYGIFMAAHAMLLISVFGSAADDDQGIADFVTLLTQGPGALAALALLGSHLWSFVSHFLGGQEYQQLRPKAAMTLPYQRVMITHVALLAGGFWLQQLGQPLGGLVILIILKIGMDLGFHAREHRQLRFNPSLESR